MTQFFIATYPSSVWQPLPARQTAADTFILGLYYSSEICKLSNLRFRADKRQKNILPVHTTSAIRFARGVVRVFSRTHNVYRQLFTHYQNKWPETPETTERVWPRMTTKPFLRFINLYDIAFIEVFLETGICLVALLTRNFRRRPRLRCKQPERKRSEESSSYQRGWSNDI